MAFLLPPEEIVYHRRRQELGVVWAEEWHANCAAILTTPTFWRVLSVSFQPRTRLSHVRQLTERDCLLLAMATNSCTN